MTLANVFRPIEPSKPVALLAVLASLSAGCSSGSPNPPVQTTPGTDAGGQDSGAPVPDSGATGEGGAVACSAHLPSGFTCAVPVPSADPHPGYFGENVTMALDENDDPMFAYLEFNAAGIYELYFTRWDPCAGAFTTPVLVDILGDGGGSPDLAYDPSTGEVGIVYTTNASGAGDGNAYTNLATLKAGAASFVVQTVSTGLDSVSGTGYPVIAMGAGNLYISYVQSDYECDLPNAGSCTGIWFLASTTTPPPADAGEETDAGPPPHYFDAQLIQFGGYPAQARDNQIGIAIDSGGKVGVAFFQPPTPTGPAYNTTLMYWRDDMANAVAVTDTADVQNDYVDLALAFEGAKPRIAAHLIADSSQTYNIIYETSDDGVTWNAPVELPEQNQIESGNSIALAFDGLGGAVIASPQNTGTPPCSNPYVATTSDDGLTWQTCLSDFSTATAATQFTDGYLNAAYGTSRLKGHYVLVLQNGEDDMSLTYPNGVWYYQSP